MHVRPLPQLLPQDPQFVGSQAESVHRALQRFRGGSQAHVLLRQAAPAGQTVPHLPQFNGSVARFVQNAPGPKSEPASEPPSEREPAPASEREPAPASEPPSEREPVLASAPPSDREPVLASAPPSTNPMHGLGVNVGQESVHAPIVHPWPLGQTVLQTPQFVGSD
jgi:hypothetical protein